MYIILKHLLKRHSRCNTLLLQYCRCNRPFTLFSNTYQNNIRVVIHYYFSIVVAMDHNIILKHLLQWYSHCNTLLLQYCRYNRPLILFSNTYYNDILVVMSYCLSIVVAIRGGNSCSRGGFVLSWLIYFDYLGQPEHDSFINCVMICQP